MEIEFFFEPESSTITYLVYDANSADAILIDPTNSPEQKTQIYSFITAHNLKLLALLDTHIHADHISLAVESTDLICGIHNSVHKLRDMYQNKYNLDLENSSYNLYFSDEDKLSFGTINVRVIHTPGHTPTCCCFLIEDCLFTGDTVFMPDFGTGRCDFPGGSSHFLYESISKIYTLADSTKVFVGHDYSPGGRPMQFETTIESQKKTNIHINESTSLEDFVKFRDERDKKLDPPRYLEESLKYNLS